jgi:DNA-binding MarR family transcriptional regulator
MRKPRRPAHHSGPPAPPRRFVDLPEAIMTYQDDPRVPLDCTPSGERPGPPANSNEPDAEQVRATLASYEGQGGRIALTLEQLWRVQLARAFTHGLKPAQWQALRYFATMPSELRSVTAFARHRCSTLGTASTTISALVQKGYLGRGEDRLRNQDLYVTAAGHRLLRQDPLRDLIARIADLGEPERAALERALPRLVRQLSIVVE